MLLNQTALDARDRYLKDRICTVCLFHVQTICLKVRDFGLTYVSGFHFLLGSEESVPDFFLYPGFYSDDLPEQRGKT